MEDRLTLTCHRLPNSGPARGVVLAVALSISGIGSSTPAALGDSAPGRHREFIVLDVAPAVIGALPGDGRPGSPFRDLDLAARAAEARSGTAPAGTDVVLRLAPGEYRLSPTTAAEPTCGNCLDLDTPVELTYGLRLTGRGIRILGAPDHASVIHTMSGYGIWVQDCQGCALEGLVLTGGVRDTSGQATDAAVVAQRSTLRIEDCVIRDNIGDPAVIEKTIVGIMGIAGREGSDLEIRHNRILRNSWDGIALYREARAVIENNVIDGVDLALGRTAGGGRGVAVGLTWNARAEVRGNYIARYWKGIGVFVDARAVVEENVLEDLATWGLTLWDADQGTPYGRFRRNVVNGTGACGASLVRYQETGLPAGSMTGNVFLRTGRNSRYDSGEPYCRQCALAIHAAPAGFPIQENLFHQNREPGGQSGALDIPEEWFRRKVIPVCSSLAGWSALRGSDFLKEFCLGLLKLEEGEEWREAGQRLDAYRDGGRRRDGEAGNHPGGIENRTGRRCSATGSPHGAGIHTWGRRG